MVQIQRVTQISESHCGPAVLQMLLQGLGIVTDQASITRAAGVEASIDEYGTRLDQLAVACQRVAPQAQFWYKQFASLEDIKYLLSQGIPVGVEWQGLFYQSLEEEAADREGQNDETDYGHYSVVVFFDEENDQLVIVDPYKDFTNRDRIFDVQTFLRRWWDNNEIRDERTGQTRMINDTHMLFFVTMHDEWLPEEYDFKRFRYAGELLKGD